MSGSPSADTWRRVVAEAWDGSPRRLLELLLQAHTTDGRNEPVPGGFYDLPDDEDLRQQIVNVLMFGPWRRTDVDTISGVFTSTFSGGKPIPSEYEISWCEARLKLHKLGALESKPDMEKMAEALGYKEAESLRKRIARKRKR